MIQAILQIFAYFPLSLGLLTFLLSFSGWDSSPVEAGAVVPTLLSLRSKVALSRRFFRMFRFLDSFHKASSLYSTKQPSYRDGKKPVEVWLDITGQSFNGMYLLLETLTLLDAMDVRGLKVWGETRERIINIEAQRFWFLSLVCGILGSLVKMVKIMAYKPVPEKGEGFGDGSVGKDIAETESKEEQPDNADRNRLVSDNGDKATPWEWRDERARLRHVVFQQREQRKRWRREVKTRSQGIVRRLLADTLDLALPGAVVGWIPASPGTVGVMMLGSTYLTGKGVWERCGRELAAARPT
jgi:hypothetical protein